MKEAIKTVTMVAFGDSITYGCGDDAVTQDDRQHSGGYVPVLSTLLTRQTGLEHHIINEGHPGETSAQGLFRLPGLLESYPDATTYLVLFGMNDARPWEPVPSGLGTSQGEIGYSGSFKEHLQQMIAMIERAGKAVSLAKIPIALGRQADVGAYEKPDLGARSVNIKAYNRVIDELVNDPENNITIDPPDLYSYFKVHAKEEYADNVHPNSKGYRSIAEAWFECLR